MSSDDALDDDALILNKREVLLKLHRLCHTLIPTFETMHERCLKIRATCDETLRLLEELDQWHPLDVFERVEDGQVVMEQAPYVLHTDWPSSAVLATEIEQGRATALVEWLRYWEFKTSGATWNRVREKLRAGLTWEQVFELTFVTRLRDYERNAVLPLRPAPTPAEPSQRRLMDTGQTTLTSTRPVMRHRNMYYVQTVTTFLTLQMQYHRAYIALHRGLDILQTRARLVLQTAERLTRSVHRGAAQQQLRSCFGLQGAADVEEAVSKPFCADVRRFLMSERGSIYLDDLNQRFFELSKTVLFQLGARWDEQGDAELDRARETIVRDDLFVHAFIEWLQERRKRMKEFRERFDRAFTEQFTSIDRHLMYTSRAHEQEVRKASILATNLFMTRVRQPFRDRKEGRMTNEELTLFHARHRILRCDAVTYVIPATFENVYESDEEYTETLTADESARIMLHPDQITAVIARQMRIVFLVLFELTTGAPDDSDLDDGSDFMKLQTTQTVFAPHIYNDLLLYVRNSIVETVHEDMRALETPSEARALITNFVTGVLFAEVTTNDRYLYTNQLHWFGMAITPQRDYDSCRSKQSSNARLYAYVTEFGPLVEEMPEATRIAFRSIFHRMIEATLARFSGDPMPIEHY